MNDNTAYPADYPVSSANGIVRRRYSALAWLAFLVSLVYYFGFGAFPMCHFKGDGTSMASGARQILEQAWDGPRNDFGHDTRPGASFTLILLRRLAGTDTDLMFSAIAPTAGIANELLVARPAAHFSRLPMPLCGLGVPIRFSDAVRWGCPGGTVANREAVRFCSGLLFHPLALHNVRRQILEASDVMKETIESHETEMPPLLVYTSEWSTCSQVHKALQDLGYSCIEQTHIGNDDKPGDRFVWKRKNHTILHIDVWEIFDPWKHPEYLQDAPSRQWLLDVTGGGRQQNEIEKSGRVKKAVFRRDVLPSGSVSVFEVSLSDAAGVPLPKRSGRLKPAR